MAPQKTAIVLENETVDKLPALTRADTLDGRYPALVEQFVGLIQQNGKKGIAQKVGPHQPPCASADPHRTSL